MTSRLGVISLFNTPAGLFRWWEEFPLRVTALLSGHGIEHVLGYKAFLPDSTIPPDLRLIAHDETDVPSRQWVHAVLGPIVGRYDRVIIHTHEHPMLRPAVWRLTIGRRDRAWWATHHATRLYRGGIRTALRRSLQRARVLMPDRHFGCSESSTRALRGMVLPGSVSTLLNGRLHDADLVPFPPRAGAARALFVGRLEYVKGVWPLLESAALLAERLPAFHLTVVGMGPEEDAMRQWIAEHNLDGRITMAGYQADVRPFYDDADVLIVPSLLPPAWSEGFGLVAVEAKVPAIPVIYSRSGGLPETQIEGETGIAVDAPTPDHIAAAMLELADNPDRYHQMRQAIRAERARWHIDRMAQRYVDEYLSALHDDVGMRRPGVH
jgi:glycosyltransferase involved in cell wall biosynthesis